MVAGEEVEATKMATVKVTAKFPNKSPSSSLRVLKVPKYSNSKVLKFSISQVPKSSKFPPNPPSTIPCWLRTCSLSNSPPEENPDPPAEEETSADDPTPTAPAEVQVHAPTEAVAPVTTEAPPGGNPAHTVLRVQPGIKPDYK